MLVSYRNLIASKMKLRRPWTDEHSRSMDRARRFATTEIADPNLLRSATSTNAATAAAFVRDGSGAARGTC
jgi:hypothetical protein